MAHPPDGAQTLPGKGFVCKHFSAPHLCQHTRAFNCAGKPDDLSAARATGNAHKLPAPAFRRCRITRIVTLAKRLLNARNSRIAA
jgi:hypothetical protein